MNKQEALKKIEKLEGLTIKDKNFNFDIEMIPKGEALKIVNQLDEPEKTVVPKFVAEWIEDHKGDYSKWDKESRADFVFRSINDLFRFEEGLSPWDFTIYEEFSKWTTENAYEFITAILFDYTVQKEKLYTVEIPNPNESDSGHIVLQKDKNNKVYIDWHYEDDWKLLKSLKLTESEIKQDFGWAWPFAEEVE